jgi:hypothetical protein
MTAPLPDTVLPSHAAATEWSGVPPGAVRHKYCPERLPSASAAEPVTMTLWPYSMDVPLKMSVVAEGARLATIIAQSLALAFSGVPVCHESSR